MQVGDLAVIRDRHLFHALLAIVDQLLELLRLAIDKVGVTALQHVVKHACRHTDHHVQHLHDGGALVVGLFTQLQAPLHCVSGKLLEHVAHAQSTVLVNDVACVALARDALQVHHLPIVLEQLLALDRIQLVAERVDVRDHLVVGGHVLAAHVCVVILTLRKRQATRVQGTKVLGVVDVAAVHAQGCPVKRGAAVGAPHLVATADLEDHYGAARAALAVAHQQLGRLHVLWLALVLTIVGIQDLVALLARLDAAHAALPLGVEETAAVGRWAVAHHLDLLLLWLGVLLIELLVVELHHLKADLSQTVLDLLFLRHAAVAVLHHQLLVAQVCTLALLGELVDRSIDAAPLNLNLHKGLSCRHQRQLALKELVAPVVLERRCDELFGKELHKVVIVPRLFARHAAWISSVIAQVALVARQACIKVTSGTLDRLAHSLVKALGTNVANISHDDDTGKT